MNDFQPACQTLFRFLRDLQILFEQLNMDIKRAERIANFMCQPREQPRQQSLLFLRRKIRHIFAQGFGENSFHEIRLKPERRKRERRLRSRKVSWSSYERDNHPSAYVCTKYAKFHRVLIQDCAWLRVILRTH